MPVSKKTCLSVALVTAIIFLHAVAIWLFFGGCFNVFDTGGMLDSYWRMFRGQTIYSDFFIQIGPVLFYTLTPFFYLFGFTMVALYAHVVFFSSLIIIGTFVTFKAKVPLWINVVITALAAVSFYLPFGFPWYTPMAHFWGMVAFFLIIHSYPFRTNTDRTLVSFASGFLAVLSILTKTNVGFFYICALSCFWIFYVRNIKAAGWYFLGAIFSFLVIMGTIHDHALFLHETVLIFGPKQAYRLDMLKELSNWFPKSYALLFLIIFINVWGYFKKVSFELFLFLASILITFADLRTSMSGPALTQMRGLIIGIGFIILFKLVQEYKSPARIWLTRVSIALLVVLSAAFGYKAFQTGQMKTIWAYGAHSPVDDQINYAPLKGWKIAKKFGEDLNNFTDYLKKNLNPGEKLLVTDTEFLTIYSLLQIDSYKKLPIWWSTIYDSKLLLGMIAKEIFEDSPPDWVIGQPVAGHPERFELLLESGRGYIPEDFFDNYALVKTGTSGFSLYKRIRN